MRVLAIEHQADAGAGVFAEAVAAAGTDLERWSPPSGEPPPALASVDAIMTFGGGMNVCDELGWLSVERGFLTEAITVSKPLLGICLGAEIVAQAAGAEVGRCARPEIGWLDVELTDAGRRDPVLGSLPERFEAFQWHSYGFSVPAGATELARSAVCTQAFVTGSAWAIQFHPEVTLADAERWIDDYRTDSDAVAMELQTEPFRARTRQRIDAWNELGRRICAAFLGAATARG